MKKQFYEQGVLITPCTEETNQYVACLLQTCKDNNINYQTATEHERAFIQKSVEEQLKGKQAV
ncbi:MAG: hypothetical protein IJ051_00715 [Clostridia bacterium]|nr:hypothetical protein [Clostridia bacterium]